MRFSNSFLSWFESAHGPSFITNKIYQIFAVIWWRYSWILINLYHIRESAHFLGTIPWKVIRVICRGTRKVLTFHGSYSGKWTLSGLWHPESDRPEISLWNHVSKHQHFWIFALFIPFLRVTPGKFSFELQKVKTNC